jgi:hypothetical protein
MWGRFLGIRGVAESSGHGFDGIRIVENEADFDLDIEGGCVRFTDPDLTHPESGRAFDFYGSAKLECAGSRELQGVAVQAADVARDQRTGWEQGDLSRHDLRF